MQDFSEQLEKELIGDWNGAKPMPDRIYFMKVLKRNLWIILGCLVVTGLATASAPLWISDSYRSSVYAVFNHQDSATPDGNSLSSQERYNTLSRKFKARFESQDFMAQLLEELGGADALSKPELSSGLPSLAGKGEISPRTLMKQYEVSPESDSGILTLNAFARNPELAQTLANTGMNAFIDRELDEQIKNLELKLDLLKKGAENEVMPKVPTPTAAEKSPAKRAEQLQNEDKERELDERLRALNNQIDQVRRERDGALTSIKRDLVKLQTNFQANHPQVVEKKKELDLVTSQYLLSEEKVVEQANGIRNQLRMVRTSQSRNPELSSSDRQILPDAQSLFLRSLSDRIREVELEKQNLIQQKSDPEKRTRLHLLYPASLEPLPFKNNSRLAQFAILWGGLVLTLLLVASREWQTPLARDAWLIERLTGKKIISQISHKNTHEYTNITPELADKMRAHLGKIHRVDEAASTLLSYRRLELAIMQQCKGNVVLLLNAGTQDQSAQVIKNFLNIYATDHQDDYLLIDCNLQDPIFSFKDGQKSALTLVDFLEGKAKFEEVCVNREQMEDFSFDVLPAMESLAGSQTRIFRPEKIAAAIEGIPFKYRKIFLRGMPASHFIENTALLASATDVFIFVDAKRTHYFELQRSLIHMESDKIRGLVAIGT